MILDRAADLAAAHIQIGVLVLNAQATVTVGAVQTFLIRSSVAAAARDRLPVWNVFGALELGS